MTNKNIGRDVRPKPDRPYRGLIKYDAQDPEAKFPPIELLHPAEGAPDGVVALLDEVGFGVSSAFGGPCQTPTAERLSDDGFDRIRLALSLFTEEQK